MDWSTFIRDNAFVILAFVCSLGVSILAFINGKQSREAAASAVSTMTAALDGVSKDYTRVKDDHQKLQGDFDALVKVREVEKTERNKVYEDMQTQLKALDDQAEKARTQANEAESKARTFEEKLQAQIARNGDLDKAIKGREDQLRILSDRITELRVNADDIAVKYDEVKRAHEKLLTENTKLHEKYTALNSQVEVMSRNHDRDIESLNKHTAEQIRTLTEANARVDGLYKALQAEQEKAKGVIMDYLGKIQRARDFLKDLGLGDNEIDDILSGKLRYGDVRIAVLNAILARVQESSSAGFEIKIAEERPKLEKKKDE